MTTKGPYRMAYIATQDSNIDKLFILHVAQRVLLAPCTYQTPPRNSCQYQAPPTPPVERGTATSHDHSTTSPSFTCKTFALHSSWISTIETIITGAVYNNTSHVILRGNFQSHI